MLINGSNIDVPVTSAAVHKATLMKEDCIRLSFNDTNSYKFKATDYITYKGVNYYLGKNYIPTMKDEATYQYDLQFNAPWYLLDNYIFFYNTYEIEEEQEHITRRESEWYITDTAANILNLIIRNTQDTERDCPCRFESLFYCEPTPVRTFTFSNTSIIGALNNLAKEFELEWWVEARTVSHVKKFFLHFGECDSSIVTEDGAVVFNEDGSRKKDSSRRTLLVTGRDVSAPSVSQKTDLKEWYYVYGSSRNIDQSVDETNITSIVTKRLAMTGNPQHKTGSGEEVVIFDDICPRSDWKITRVTPIEIQSDEVIGYDNDGNEVFKKFNVYDICLGNDDNPTAFSDYVFDTISTDPEVQNLRDMVASGKNLSIKFIIKDEGSTTNTPKLAGFEFEVAERLKVNSDSTFPDKAPTFEWYELQILKQDINGYIIPNDTIVPTVGDWVCLFNIKAAYIDANEKENAQAELQSAFNKYYNNLKRDVSYTVKPYVDKNINLDIGDAVTLIYGSNTVVSRISSFEKKIDYNIEASYVISSFVQPSTVNQLKEEVKTITANIANGTALRVDTGAIRDIVYDYGKNVFLSKIQDDTAQGVITFSNLVKLSRATASNTIGTPTFVEGFTGSGWQIDENGNLTVGSLTVRQTMRVFEMLIQQVRATGGEIIVSPANGKVSNVVSIDGTTPSYRLTIDSGYTAGSLILSMFRAGDYVRCQKWDSQRGTVKFYWVRVRGVFGNLVVVNQADFENGNIPEIGDELVLFGSENAGRQGAITISAIEDGSPKITILDGIDGAKASAQDLTGCTRAVLGDLSGITDEDMGTLEGYGLYSDNVYLKGKLALSDGTLISDELTDIRSGKIHLSGETTVDNDFFVRNLETIPDTSEDESNKAKVKIEGSLMEVFGATGTCNIRFGVDTDTHCAVLKYYDNDGNFLYDLGPSGLRFINVVEAKYITHTLYKISDGTSVTVYYFTAKRVAGIIAADTGAGEHGYAPTDEIARLADGLYFRTDGTITMTGGNLENIARYMNLRRATDNAISVNNNHIKEGWETAEDVKEFLKGTYNLTDSDLEELDFTLEDDGMGGQKLKNDITLQRVTDFINGNRSEYWGLTQEQ